MTYPFNDNSMVYDYNRHMYILTQKGVLDELGINLDLELNTADDANPSRLVDRFLTKVSQTVYNYYYQDSANNAWQTMQIAKNPEIREQFKEVLLAQVLYVLANGFINLYSGVNVAKGSAMNVNVLRSNAKVADEVVTFGERIISNVGVCLLYAGVLPVPCDKEGY